MHIKEPLLLIGKHSLCGGSGFPLFLSEWFFTICPTPYNRKENVLSASLNKTFPSFQAEWEIPEKTPPINWPHDGAVSFYNYHTRYRPGLDLVLKGLNCSIQGGEKVRGHRMNE